MLILKHGLIVQSIVLLMCETWAPAGFFQQWTNSGSGASILAAGSINGASMWSGGKAPEADECFEYNAYQCSICRGLGGLTPHWLNMNPQW